MTRDKRFKRAGNLGIGVTDEYKVKNLLKTTIIKLYRCHEAMGLKSSLYYTVNDINRTSRGFAESIGGRGWILYLEYDKILN